jgi:hypothetical protein
MDVLASEFSAEILSALLVFENELDASSPSKKDDGEGEMLASPGSICGIDAKFLEGEKVHVSTSKRGLKYGESSLWNKLESSWKSMSGHGAH